MSYLSVVLPRTEKKTAITLSISFVANYGQTALECRFESRPVLTLLGSRKASLLGVLLPLVDGVRDCDAFEDLLRLRLAAKQIGYTVGAQPPFRIQPIGREASLQRGGGRAIEVGLVAPYYDAETADVQVGVPDFQGIEGPLHEIEATGDGVVALGELETTADAEVAILRKDGEHVRVEVGFAVAVARQGHGEAYDGVSVEGSKNLTADPLRDHEDASWDDVAIAVTPDFELEDDTALKVLEAGEGLDVDSSLGGGVHDLVGSATTFFA
jgi:hypothetical protein